MYCQRDKKSDWVYFCHWCKGFLVVNSTRLCKSHSYEFCFVPLYINISVAFNGKHLFAGHYFLSSKFTTSQVSFHWRAFISSRTTNFQSTWSRASWMFLCTNRRVIYETKTLQLFESLWCDKYLAIRCILQVRTPSK